MTLYDFIQLDEMEQIEAYWNGIEVGSFTKNGKIFECRQIEDFYVEYRIEARHYFEMKCHKNTNLIEPFLSDETLDL